MLEKVYHGSYTKIDEIDLRFSRKMRDFGRGFYVTNILSQAEYWAERKRKWRKKQKGYVTEFGLSRNFIRVLNLKVLHFEGYTGEWLDFVATNRANDLDNQTHDYDIVEGPVADDDISKRVINYIREEISKEQFLKEISHKYPTHQMCFCTKLSLKVLVTAKQKLETILYHTDSEIMQHLMIDYGKTKEEAMDIFYSSKTYAQYADETIELYKETWQKIYEMLKTELKNTLKHD